MEEIIKKTRTLTDALRQTEDYQRYQKHLKMLRAQPDVYSELNAYRRKNIELQMLAQTEEYDEETEKLQAQYKNILMESVVINFLTSEQSVCKMMREVYEQIACGIDLDISYMEE